MSRRASAAGLLALCLALATPASAREASPTPIPVRDARLLDAAVAALPAQRPGVVDLYAIGVAGDATEDVFRNEARYFVDLARQRLRARGAIALVNHLDSIEGVPAPLATYDNLARLLRGVASRMDPAEDIVLLYLTMHGTREHELAVVFPPFVEDLLLPEDVDTLLDDAGIRHRVVVVSACYSGGFIPRLRGPDTVAMTAARADRPSFGCGSASNVTFFGRAWMVEGLNRHADLMAAFDEARAIVGAWELGEALAPSQPQLSAGRRIRKRLALWQAQTPPGPPLPYPHPLEAVGDAVDPAAGDAGPGDAEPAPQPVPR